MFDLQRSDVALLQGVFDHGSLHGAQRHGHITQSAAGRRLTNLERQLRTQLVSRGATGAKLTEAGRALLYVGRRLMGAIDYGMAASDHSAENGPHLRVLQLAFATEAAGELGTGLAARAVNAVFDPITMGQAQAWACFERYAVDIVCGWTRRYPPIKRPGSVLATVLEEPQLVALPRDHPLAHHSALELPELATLERIAIAAESTASGDLSHALARFGVTPRIRCTVHSEAAARELVTRGYGFALVSLLSGQPDGDDGLVLRPLRQQLSRRLAVAFDPTLLSSALAEQLCAGLRHRYLELAEQRNPAYFRRPGRALPPTAAPVPMPAALASTPVAEPRCVPTRQHLPLLISERHRAADGPSSLVEAEHLRLLRVIQRTGSLNRAATELLVTQPALTRRIHRLERICGQTLVHSASRGTSLSTTARRLLRCTEVAEHRLEALVETLRQSRPPVAERVVPRQGRISVPEPPKSRSSEVAVSATEWC